MFGLEADDGLAAEAAGAKLFEHLARIVQCNRGADARRTRPFVGRRLARRDDVKDRWRA